jgi:hypothetical protein
LLACWDAKAAGGQGSGSWWEADCTTDALPALVCGRDGAQCWPTARGWAYDWSSAEERNRVQATLSRAIRTLYGKGLLDCGGRGDATGHGDARGGGAYIKTLRLTHAGALVAARLHETLRTKTHTES